LPSGRTKLDLLFHPAADFSHQTDFDGLDLNRSLVKVIQILLYLQPEAEGPLEKLHKGSDLHEILSAERRLLPKLISLKTGVTSQCEKEAVRIIANTTQIYASNSCPKRRRILAGSEVQTSLFQGLPPMVPGSFDIVLDG
jgi:hypothetical protein